jgi:hypothetical protein
MVEEAPRNGVKAVGNERDSMLALEMRGHRLETPDPISFKDLTVYIFLFSIHPEMQYSSISIDNGRIKVGY